MGQCTLSKFADYKHLGGVVDTPEGFADIDRLKKWADRNFVNFRKFLYCGRNNIRHQCMLGANLMENIQGIWLDTKSNVLQLQRSLMFSCAALSQVKPSGQERCGVRTTQKPGFF